MRYKSIRPKHLGRKITTHSCTNHHGIPINLINMAMQCFCSSGTICLMDAAYIKSCGRYGLECVHGGIFCINGNYVSFL